MGERDGLRDRQYWEKWIRDNAETVRGQTGSLRDWLRAAGVAKGERRAFRSALKSLGAAGVRGKGGKFPRGRPGGRTVERPAEAAGRRRPTDEGPPRTMGRPSRVRRRRPSVIPDSPDEPAIRIPGHALGAALPKDRVEVRVERRRGGAPPHGRIVRIVERGIRQFVARYDPLEGRPFLRFRDREADLRLPVAVTSGPLPEPGEIVLAEVAEYPGAGREGLARIVRVLGKEHTMETIALAVTAARDIPADFSAEALAEAARIPMAVRAGKPGGGGGARDARLERVDLRSFPFVTIDGEDARDFDDAICLVRDRGGQRLLVAIADVSHYVGVGSALDRDAYVRGTSVYFPDRCIPMLPPPLSEGVCSLKPGVNRLTMTVDIPVDPQGRPAAASFYPSVIRSRARLTYDEVHELLSRPAGPPGRGRISPEVGAMLRRMASLAGLLTLARADRGSLDFDLPEAKFVVEGGLPVAVEEAPRWESHRLIEEFMLLANTAAAEFLAARGAPFPSRIHEPPAEDRLEEFEDTAARLLRRSRVTDSRDPAARLMGWAAAARGGKYERHINMLLLRSLMLARYGPELRGHFGLALSRYTHFTSPIRRYPDLVVHRALKAALGDRSLELYLSALAEGGEEIGRHLSFRERAAMDAERDVEQRAKALLLLHRVGETFTGVISSITGYGFHVALAECFAEGFVHIATLRDDDYRYSVERGEWFGVLRKTRLGPGDRVRVRLRRADVERGEIDLLYVEKLPDNP